MDFRLSHPYLYVKVNYGTRAHQHILKSSELLQDPLIQKSVGSGANLAPETKICSKIMPSSAESCDILRNMYCNTKKHCHVDLQVF